MMLVRLNWEESHQTKFIVNKISYRLQTRIQQLSIPEYITNALQFIALIFLTE